jgi:hypothetical protein
MLELGIPSPSIFAMDVVRMEEQLSELLKMVL